MEGLQKEQVEKYLDNDFVHAYKHAVEFIDRHCDSKLQHQLKATRKAYSLAHVLLFETLVRACNVSRVYFKSQTREWKEIEDSFEILSHIKTLLPVLLPQTELEIDASNELENKEIQKIKNLLRSDFHRVI